MRYFKNQSSNLLYNIPQSFHIPVRNSLISSSKKCISMVFRRGHFNLCTFAYRVNSAKLRRLRGDTTIPPFTLQLCTLSITTSHFCLRPFLSLDFLVLSLIVIKAKVRWSNWLQRNTILLR